MFLLDNCVSSVVGVLGSTDHIHLKPGRRFFQRWARTVSAIQYFFLGGVRLFRVFGTYCWGFLTCFELFVLKTKEIQKKINKDIQEQLK